jgi:hypothetical protein
VEQTQLVSDSQLTVRRHPHAVRTAIGIVVIAGYAWTAGHFATFTRPAAVATFVPGVLGVADALIDRSPRPIRAGRRRGSWLPWVAIAAAVTGLEVTALATGAGPAHPTISDLLNPLLLSTPSRALGFAAWLATGIWLSRR